MSKILVISTSLRNDSNSECMAWEFAKGARDNGCEVETITLRDYPNIAFCKGCLACQKLSCCVINDDAIVIAEKMLNADAICFATPIYYYSMSGQMKTLLDRCNSLYCSDYKFRNVYLLMSAAEDDANTPEKTITALQGWIECFEKATLMGCVFAGGVSDAGDVSGHKALAESYTLGNSAE